MLEHPDITNTLRTGFPTNEPRISNHDSLGNQIYSGDSLLEFEDEIYVAEELSSDAIKILEKHGATYVTAR